MAEPIPAGFELKNKIAELQEMLLLKHPMMPKLLQEIHSTLRKQPENVTLLDEEDIRIIVNGLEKQTGVELAASVSKSSKSASSGLKNKIANLGADAF